MKKLIPLIVLLFVSLSCSAQSWSPVNPGLKRYYTNKNGYLKGVRIDSVAAFGSDLYYYPFKTYRTVYTNTMDLGHDTVGSWLGEKIIKKANGTLLFPNYWQDTIVVRSQATPGESWIFHRDGTGIYYTAQLMSVDTMTILGTVDSIKRILLSAYNNGNPLPTDSFDNVEIILSKNHGFYSVLDLYMFPYHPHDTSVVVYEYYLNYSKYRVTFYGVSNSGGVYPGRKSSVFTLTDYTIPAPDKIYDWNVGDVYEYEQCTAGLGDFWGCQYPFTYYLDTIVSKTVTSAGTQYIRRGWRATQSYANLQHYYALVAHSDTIFVPNTGNVLNTELMPEEIDLTSISLGPFPLYYYIPGDTSLCSNGTLYFTYTDNFPYFRPYSFYKGGVGLVHFNNGGESSMVVDTTLLFSIRNGVFCGTFVLPDTSFPVSVKKNFSFTDGFKVFPNPAYDQLTIESSFSDYQLSLINALGQITYIKSGCSESTTVDVSGFASGVYHLKLDTGKGEVVNRKIVIQH